MWPLPPRAGRTHHLSVTRFKKLCKSELAPRSTSALPAPAPTSAAHLLSSSIRTSSYGMPPQHAAAGRSLPPGLVGSGAAAARRCGRLASGATSVNFKPCCICSPNPQTCVPTADCAPGMRCHQLGRLAGISAAAAEAAACRRALIGSGPYCGEWRGTPVPHRPAAQVAIVILEEQVRPGCSSAGSLGRGSDEELGAGARRCTPCFGSCCRGPVMHRGAVS